MNTSDGLSGCDFHSAAVFNHQDEAMRGGVAVWLFRWLGQEGLTKGADVRLLSWGWGFHTRSWFEGMSPRCPVHLARLAVHLPSSGISRVQALHLGRQKVTFLHKMDGETPKVRVGS